MRKSELRRVVRKVKLLLIGYAIVTLITLALVRMIPADRKIFESPSELKDRMHRHVESLGYTSSPHR
ncbi:MAG TPA: hypothetical protein VGL91_12010 [Acidobacteriota bacterium]